MKNLEKAAKEFKARDSEPISGGIITELSDCCNAPLKHNEGGVVFSYCSKCGKEYKETLVKNDVIF